MKKVADGFEAVLDELEHKQWQSVFVVILLVLFLSAGSLYMLLNTSA